MNGQIPTDNVNNIIEKELHEQIKELGEHFEADVITFFGGLVYGTDDKLRHAIEQIDSKKQKLLFVLETTGGSIDVAERIANTLRHHYQEVDFLIPNYAYSAGTILTMCGDSIHMDYYAVLGPIDPQVNKQGVGWVPALGYLAKFNELINNPNITEAEIAFLCQKFDPAELHAFENAKNQSITLLKKWLVNFKFKDWKMTETNQQNVTQDMKMQRAEEIAKKLNDTELWHSHNRGIPMQDLRDIVNLKIEDFSNNPDADTVVKKYYQLLKEYAARQGSDSIIHSPKELITFWS